MKLFTAIAMLLFFGGAFAQQPKNILVIMTDDQRWDTVDQMPNLSSIASAGVTFSNAFQATPLCGPSRSSLLSGGYHSQDTGVYGNNLPNGGVTRFNDKTNIGVMLQGAGYSTTFIGKWVNGYEGLGKYVPPGWTHWVGRHSFATGASWFQFQYVLGTSTASASGQGTIVNSNAYTTYYERDTVLATINAAAANPTNPFFILWMPSAPHAPATPAPEDVGLFSDFTYQGRGVTETDLTDKPKWVQTFKNNASAYGNTWGDPYVKNTLRSLQSVDRSIKSIIDQLQANGQLSDTIVIYTSDNGYMWGEHGLWQKSKPYLESLHVPFVVLAPGVAPRSDSSIIAPSLDIGPTLFELAGVSKTTQGMSIIPLLNDPATSWRSNLYIEESDNSLGGNAIYAGIADLNHEYVNYWTGEEELYDVVADPFQLSSLDKDPTQVDLKTSMLANTQAQLGLAIIPAYNFNRKRGAPFSYQMRLWGGFAPFTWTVHGSLPPGITLGATTGLISGVPTTAGTYSFSLQVLDSAISPQTLAPHTFTSRAMQFVIN